MTIRRAWTGFGIAAATLLVAGCAAVPKAEAPPPAPALSRAGLFALIDRYPDEEPQP